MVLELGVVVLNSFEQAVVASHEVVMALFELRPGEIGEVLGGRGGAGG